jgi:hypothetical protein
MASNVIAAFEEFLRDRVNLAPSASKGARTSRDWLLAQIGALPLSNGDFPPLYPDVNIHYGSFARRTKIRELDDVDLIVGISALGPTYEELRSEVRLSVPDGIILRSHCHDGTNQLNSRKVINLFVRCLADVPQYEKSEIKRNGSAAVLNLQSYEWSFDIVPGFFTTPEANNRTYYVIPNGNGHWMKTDPRIDNDRVAALNQMHDGHVLNAVRLMKYWNGRATMPTMPSYLLESIVLQHYASASTKATPYADVEAVWLFDYIAAAVYTGISDPKGIQGDINTLSWLDRQTIAMRAQADARKSRQARTAEDAGDQRTAIRLWREILGSDFPDYV